jgi:hypothetical protein
MSFECRGRQYIILQIIEKNTEKNKLDVLVNLVIQRFSNPGKQPKLQLQYPSDESSSGHQVNMMA